MKIDKNSARAARQLMRACVDKNGRLQQPRVRAVVKRLSESLAAIARSTNHTDTYKHFLETKAILAEVLPEEENPLVVDCVVNVDTKRLADLF